MAISLFVLNVNLNWLIVVYCIILEISVISNFANEKHLMKQSIEKNCKYQIVDQYDICGIGIYSTGGHKCIKWKYSNYNNNKLNYYNNNNDKQLENTTFCKKYNNNYYCATNSYKYLSTYYWDYCKPINCIRSNNICQENIYWKTTISTIQIDLSQSIINNIIIFSYLPNNKCSIYTICDKCPDHFTHNYFLSCETMKVKQSGRIYNFLNLSQNAQIIFYIIPIINRNRIGSISELSFKTLIAKPNIPFNIQIINTTTNNIFLKWNQPIENEIFAPIEKYKIETTSNNNNNNNYSNIINTTINNYYLATNLQQCKKYCFQISAINVVGKTEKLNKICATTANGFDKIEKLSTESHSISSSIIKWQYKNSCNSSIKFTIKYYLINSINNYHLIKSNNQSILLRNLNTNANYIVQVRPETKNGIGSFSLQFTFNKYISKMNVKTYIKFIAYLIIIGSIIGIIIGIMMRKYNFKSLCKKKDISAKRILLEEKNIYENNIERIDTYNNNNDSPNTSNNKNIYENNIPSVDIYCNENSANTSNNKNIYENNIPSVDMYCNENSANTSNNKKKFVRK